MRLVEQFPPVVSEFQSDVGLLGKLIRRARDIECQSSCITMGQFFTHKRADKKQLSHDGAS